MKPRYSATIVLIIAILVIAILVGALFWDVELFLLCAIPYCLLFILFKIREDEE